MYAASPFASPRSAQGFAHAYRQVGVETGVAAASPHQLVAMLYSGLLDALAQARGAMRAGQVAVKASALVRAHRIVEEGLRAPLDLQAGGALAEQLGGLYGYIAQRLLHANLRNDEQAIDECVKLIEPLKEAWDGIRAQAPVASR